MSSVTTSTTVWGEAQPSVATVGLETRTTAVAGSRTSARRRCASAAPAAFSGSSAARSSGSADARYARANTSARSSAATAPRAAASASSSDEPGTAANPRHVASARPNLAAMGYPLGVVHIVYGDRPVQESAQLAAADGFVHLDAMADTPDDLALPLADRFAMRPTPGCTAGP